MGTTFAEVLTSYFMVLQNDERLTYDMQRNPAQTFRKLYLYMKNAIPMFTIPPQAQQWLAYTPAQYDDYQYISSTAQTAPIEIPTQLTGYEICSVGTTSTDSFGRVVYTPLNASYDSETGTVTVNSDLAENQQVEIDFYTDGIFSQTLNNQMKYILGLCLQYVWELRYANNYLGMAPKANDKSSKFNNENEKVKADTQRLQFLKTQIDGELHNFEQGILYSQKVPVGNQPTMPN